MICIFDCETVPDAKLIKQTMHLNGDDIEVSVVAMSEQKEKTGSSFLPVAYHKIVAISAVIADDFGVFKKVSSIEGKDEEEMLKNFLSFLDKYQPRLISFNGRNFDIPMMMIRAMKYSLTCNAYFEVDNKELNKNKWDNYRSRYSDRFHLDLMDVISEFGSARGLKLDVLCSLIGAPGKYDVSGDMVFELFYEGEIEKIKEYCESDVLNTYWLFLKYELLRGRILSEDFKNNLAIMRDKLDDNKSYATAFKEAIDNELNL